MWNQSPGCSICIWAITWYKNRCPEEQIKLRTGTCWAKKIQIWWLSLTCPSASFALQYSNFVPRDCSAAKVPFLDTSGCVNKIHRALNYHKNKKLGAVPLDVVPKLRTQRCSPRFRPGRRFGTKSQIPVARQRGREMSVPRPYFFFWKENTLFTNKSAQSTTQCYTNV